MSASLASSPFRRTVFVILCEPQYRCTLQTLADTSATVPAPPMLFYIKVRNTSRTTTNKTHRNLMTTKPRDFPGLRRGFLSGQPSSHRPLSFGNSVPAGASWGLRHRHQRNINRLWAVPLAHRHLLHSYYSFGPSKKVAGLVRTIFSFYNGSPLMMGHGPRCDRVPHLGPWLCQRNTTFIEVYMVMPVILSGSTTRWAMVDDDDYDLVTGREWRIHSGGYATALIDGRWTYMHRFILGAQRGQIVDHMNGDRLDNRRGNLRFTNPAINTLNSGRVTSSIYPGVCLPADRLGYDRPYVAQIRYGGRNRRIGFFASELEAYAAYCDRYVEFYGIPAPTLADLPRKVVAA